MNDVFNSVLIPLGVSLVASFIFWLFSSFIPNRVRFLKVRPKVEFDICEILNGVHSYLKIALKINEYGWEFPFNKIEAGQATKDDFALWLQNKCLNSTYQYDAMGKYLLPVGERLESCSREICRKIELCSTYYAFMSADEILVLRRIAAKVRVYSYCGSAEDIINGVCYRPVNPTIAYMAENFFEISKHYLELEGIAASYKGIDASINKYLLGIPELSKAKRFYIAGEFKKCIRLVKHKSLGNRMEGQSLLFKAYYCLGNKGRAISALRAMFDLTDLKPVSFRNTFSDLHINFHLLDDDVISELHSHYPSKEIEMVRALDKESHVIAEAVAKNRLIMAFYEKKQ